MNAAAAIAKKVKKISSMYSDFTLLLRSHLIFQQHFFPFFYYFKNFVYYFPYCQIGCVNHIIIIFLVVAVYAVIFFVSPCIVFYSLFYFIFHFAFNNPLQDGQGIQQAGVREVRQDHGPGALGRDLAGVCAGPAENSPSLGQRAAVSYRDPIQGQGPTAQAGEFCRQLYRRSAGKERLHRLCLPAVIWLCSLPFCFGKIKVLKK